MLLRERFVKASPFNSKQVKPVCLLNVLENDSYNVLDALQEVSLEDSAVLVLRSLHSSINGKDLEAFSDKLSFCPVDYCENLLVHLLFAWAENKEESTVIDLLRRPFNRAELLTNFKSLNSDSDLVVNLSRKLLEAFETKGPCARYIIPWVCCLLDAYVDTFLCDSQFYSIMATLRRITAEKLAETDSSESTFGLFHGFSFPALLDNRRREFIENFSYSLESGCL